MGGDGTGFLIQSAGRYFIGTCRHVADAFFGTKRPYVILRDNTRIQTEQLKYSRHTDIKLDTALIEIISDFPKADWFELEDFESIDNFATYDFEKTNLLLCGFPSELRTEKDDGFYSMPLTFSTVVDKDRPNSEEFIFAKYPVSEEVQVTDTEQTAKLPAAPGLSGAVIFKMEQFEADSDDLWAAGLGKIIAIQIKWDGLTWIKGVNIRHLLLAIDDVLSTSRVYGHQS